MTEPYGPMGEPVDQGPARGLQKAGVGNVVTKTWRSIRDIISTIPTLILIILLITAVFAGYTWMTSEQGQRGFLDLASSAGNYFNDILTKYLSTISEKATLTGKSKPAKIQSGLVLKGLERFAGNSMLSGTNSKVRYNFDIAVQKTTLDEDVKINLTCEVKPKEVVKGEVEYHKNQVIPAGTDNIENLYCRFLTKGLKSDKTVNVEGYITFPYETKDAKVSAYFVGEDYVASENDKYEMVTDYDGEPVAIIFSMETPARIGKDRNAVLKITYVPKWGGSLVQFKSAKLMLPEKIKLYDDDEIILPYRECPFDPNTLHVEEGKNVYEADMKLMKLYEEVGALASTKMYDLACELTSDIDFGGVPKSATIIGEASYIYKSVKKAGSSMTLKKAFEEESTDSEQDKTNTAKETTTSKGSGEGSTSETEEPFENPVDLSA